MVVQRSDKTYKDVKVATYVEANAEVTLSTRIPGKPLPQRKHPAQRRPIEWAKFLRLLLRKPVLQNSVRRVLVLVMILHDSNCIDNFECCNFVSFS